MSAWTPQLELNSQSSEMDSIQNYIAVLGRSQRSASSLDPMGHWKMEDTQSHRTKKFAGLKLLLSR